METQRYTRLCQMDYFLTGCFCKDCTQKIEECLKLLLKNGADPSLKNGVNGDQQTPLDLVVDNMVHTKLGGLLDPNKHFYYNNNDIHIGNNIQTDNFPWRIPRNDNGKKCGIGNEGIVNVTLAKKLVDEMPETVNDMLDHGVRLVPPSDAIPRDGADERVNPTIELDWSYLVYSKLTVTSQAKGQPKHWYETEFLHDVMKSHGDDTQKIILEHPLVKAFLERKQRLYWKYFGGYYFSWILVTFILYLAFIWTLYNDVCRYDKRIGHTLPPVSEIPVHSSPRTSTSNYIRDSDAPTDKDGEVDDGFRCYFDNKLSILAYIILVLYTTGPVWVEFREFSAIGAVVYFRDWQNYVIIFATIIAATTLFPALTLQDYYKFNWEYAVAASGMLIGSLVIMIQLTNITQIAVYVQMVFKIFIRIGLATIILSPILVGFYFSFRILITDQDIGVFKLLNMIVSSDDFEEFIDHDRGVYYTLVAYLFFSAFIILVLIVVLNFLVGLAVDDIQELKRKAISENNITRIRNFYLMDTFLGKPWKSCAVTRNETTFKFCPFNKKDGRLPKKLKLELLAIARKICLSRDVEEIESKRAYPVAAYNHNVTMFDNNYKRTPGSNNNSEYLPPKPHTNSHFVDAGRKSWYNML